MENSYINLNNGAYGTIPRVVLAEKLRLLKLAESNPDRYIRCEMSDRYTESLKLVSNVVNCDWDDLTFCHNTTAGVNAIVRSITAPEFTSNQKKRKILYFSTIYGAVENTLLFYAKLNNFDLIKVNLFSTFDSEGKVEFDNEKIARALKDRLEKEKGHIFLCVFDWISSVPGFLFPIKSLVHVAHSYDSLVLIDAAHSIGQIKVDLNDLNPDFLVTNLHKWMHCPRGSALLYARKELKNSIYPNVISFGFSKKDKTFQDQFGYVGTEDQINYFCTSKAIEFRNWLGGEEKIINYTHNLAIQGGKLLAKKFTTYYFGADDQIASMVNVKLPKCNKTINDVYMAGFLKFMLHKHRVCFTPFKLNEEWFIRLSAQVFNCLNDFEIVGDLILKEINSLENGESKL
ncbi:hypothetical protein HDU92_000098 [Lobulomyces angularis]|nr:hypothetical protein HDU92_000098 [Lobulomyces angularis]